MKDKKGLISAEAYSGQCKGIVSKDYFEIHQEIGIEDILDKDSEKYFTLIAYGAKNAQNPVESDNKITVLSEKVSYKLGETARVLVRLPFSNGKILWTVEKQGVVHHEYIDVPGNTFFKEVKVDDTFIPNAYIGVVVVPTALTPTLSQGERERAAS